MLLVNAMEKTVRRRYREEECSCCLQNRELVMYGLGLISVLNGPKRSLCQCLSYLSEVFSHTRAFHLPSLLPVQVSLCFLYYPTSSSELPERKLPYCLVFQFTLLFPHQSPNVVVSFSSPIPGSRPPSSTSPPIHRAAGLHDHIGLWDNGCT